MDGYLVPGFRFEKSGFSALRPKLNTFRIRKKCYFAVKFVVSLIIFVNDCRHPLKNIGKFLNF